MQHFRLRFHSYQEALRSGETNLTSPNLTPSRTPPRRPVLYGPAQSRQVPPKLQLSVGFSTANPEQARPKRSEGRAKRPGKADLQANANPVTGGELRARGLGWGPAPKYAVAWCLVLLVLVGFCAAEQPSQSLRLEPFRRQVTLAGDLRVDIAARLATLGVQSQEFVLEGIDPAIFYDTNQVFTLRAASGQWNPRNRTIRTAGDVNVSIWLNGKPPVTHQLQTSVLEYDQNLGIVLIPGEFTVRGTESLLKAGKADARLGEDWLRLQEGVSADLAAGNPYLALEPGQNLRLTCQSAIVHPNSGDADFLGGVTLLAEGDDVRLTGERLELRTEAGQRVVRVLGNVTLHAGARDGHPPTWLTCEELRLLPDTGLAQARGKVLARQGRQSFTAAEADLFLAPGLGEVRSLAARGGVTLIGEQGTLSGRRLTVNRSADRVVVLGSPRMTTEDRVVHADAIVTDLNFSDVRLEGRVRLEKRPPRPGSSGKRLAEELGGDANLTFAANSVQLDQEGGWVYLRGKARIERLGTELRAENIAIRVEDSPPVPPTTKGGKRVAALVAWPSVTVSGKGSFGQSEVAVFLLDEGRYVLDGNARLFQMENSLSAERIHVWPETEVIYAEGRVAGRFANDQPAAQPQAASAPEERVSSAGQLGLPAKMSFGAQVLRTSSRFLRVEGSQGVARLWGDVVLRGERDGDLRAAELTLYFENEARQFQGMHATGRVVLREKARQVMAEELLYRFAGEVLVLRGRPAMAFEPSRGASGEFLVLDGARDRFCNFGGEEFSSEAIRLAKDDYLKVYGDTFGRELLDLFEQLQR